MRFDFQSDKLYEVKSQAAQEQISPPSPQLSGLGFGRG